MENLETFPRVFCFTKSRINENGGNGSFSGWLFLRELCSFQWVANPVNDMYADAVLAVILQVESNPTTAQGNCYRSLDNFIAFRISGGLLASYNYPIQLSSVNS